MVLPLLGLAGLAVGAAALPHVQNYQDRVRRGAASEAREEALAGLDMSNPSAVSSALFGAGLTDPEDFMSDLRGAFESQADRDAAMARQRVSSGPAYMNAQTNRLRMEAELQLAEQARIQANAERAMQEQWEATVIDRHGTPFEREQLENPMTPPRIRQGIADGILERNVQPMGRPEPLGGPTATNRQMQRIERLQMTNTLLEDVVGGIDDWVDTIGSPSLTPGEQANRMRTEANVASYIRSKYFAETGAEMNDEAFQSALNYYPVPRTTSGGAVEWLLGGKRVTNEAVKEFWKRELQGAGQATRRAYENFIRQQSGYSADAELELPDLGLLPGSVRE